MTPEQVAKPGTEHAHQCALFCWANKQLTTWPELEWMYAVPNAAERSVVVASRMKAEGLKSGVSDVCIPVPRKKYNGFYIEMKKPGNAKGETDNQKKFGAFVTAQGYLYACFDHWEKARDAIIWYMTKIEEEQL